MKQAILPPPSIAKTLTLTGFVLSIAFVANPAQAAIFTVGGIDYNITTVTGSYNSLASQLTTTPWFGNQTTALTFASTVGTFFGSPNSLPIVGSAAPLFLYSNSPSLQSRARRASNGSFLTFQPAASGNYTYAVGSVVSSSAVPEPLTILGAMTAAGFGASFKRKLAKSKKDQEDA